MGKEAKKTQKQRYSYPIKALVPIYWVIIGISFILIFILPINSGAYAYGMIIGLIIWTPFMVGAILYSNYFERQGVRICANCGRHAYRGRKHCEKCGARVFWRCPKCDARTNKYLDFCKECGQSLKVVTFSRQMEFDDLPKPSEEESELKDSNLVVIGSVVQFCPSCGAEISEDLTHCSICGSKFDR